MKGKKIFIGFDLGDGESITDFVIRDATDIKEVIRTNFVAMTMPDSNEPGKAIPTVYGYGEDGKLVFAQSILIMPELVKDIQSNFKRRPCDLCKGMPDERVFSDASGWPSQKECPECCTPEMEVFRKAVVTFTNAVFENPEYKRRVESQAVDCDEIVFCVGHPTRWTNLDVLIYKVILQGSILGKGSYAGKKTRLIMAAESRAAFLTVKDKANEKVLPKGTSVLLIDVGSSTIDITALTADSHNYQYNGGNNYLGARSIDYIIREMYLEWLKKSPDDWESYQKLNRSNPSFNRSLTVACRMAKEAMYTVEAGMARITFYDFAPFRIKRDDVEQAIRRFPVAKILAEHASLPSDQQNEMGDRNWIQLFTDYFQEQKREISKRGIRIGRVILTGSASKMPFVLRIIKEVFNDLPQGSVLMDMDPSRSISMGLALVGPSNEKSVEFQKDLDTLIERELPDIIERDLPNLADSLSDVIDRVVTGIVKDNMRQWRSGSIDTLDDMTAKIRRDCGEEKLQKVLLNNKAYNEAIRKWTVEIVGQDIAQKLQQICKRYGVSDISIEDLNIFQTPEIEGFNVNLDVLDFADTIIAIVAVIAGIITAIVLPTVLGIIIGLISWISVGIASFLLTILLAIPGAGWLILLAVAGIAVVKAAASGMASAKEELVEKMQSMSLPQWIRNRMTDEKIDAEIKKAGIKTKIQQSIMEEKSKQDIIGSVSANLRGQIEKRAEDIKYVIESR